ncbi:spermidine synthase [Baekduia sp. Peel2402]|uniref:spermidine synthase n=1 Tax=Baekduia sp. Peel2402 TaxID=3458296 RepID=UPI00403E83E3
MQDRRSVALVAAVVGAATLGAEIAAARLLAPWFGASTIVWANTIATVLVALSGGYYLGGRLADRDPTFAGLCKLVLLGAGLMAAVPFVAGPFLRVSVDALDSVEAGAFVGSLLAVLILIAAPVLVLGCVSPYAVRLSVGALDEAGRVAGRLYAISTLGSLAGVFLSALVLIPFVGTRRTFLVFALALGLAAILGLRQRVALLAPALVALLIALPTGTVKATTDGRVIWEAETEYQYARVVEFDDGERQLELNEGQAVHSVFRPGTYLTGNYWDEPLVLPFAGRATPPRSIAILGSAAGTVARAYGHYFPATRIDAVEIDGELTEVGERLFDFRAPHLETHAADARPWLRATDRRFDVIYVDAYRQPYIPFYLATKEFFRLARERLNPGGMVIVNVGHPEDSNKLEKVLTATMGSVFGHVARDPAQDVNTQLIASENPVTPEILRASIPALPAELRATAGDTAARLAGPLRGGRVYTDDVAPVEWLIDASIVQVAADGER